MNVEDWPIIAMFCILFGGFFAFIIWVIIEASSDHTYSYDEGVEAAIAYNLQSEQECREHMRTVDQDDYDLVEYLQGCTEQATGAVK